ncbi:hypothetical protein [Amycolatopsis sp.]|uniref:hypothetical protein n=1 Tax=Amycolatopsis sp. TaxID=37632 RepID=UPI002C922647|nr:hypothetical protein [Amycolatopsis sp.]HVV13388.1 hypothetical protein [Amycolatopsis sp.]
MAVGGVGHHAHDSGCLAQHHGVRPAAPGEFEAGGDHRIDPAALFGLRPGDAPVIRNAGGRITTSVLEDLGKMPSGCSRRPAYRDADGPQ